MTFAGMPVLGIIPNHQFAATVAQEQSMATSFKSILSDVGSALRRFFGVAIEAAQAVEPIVDIALPGVASLYNATVAEAVNAEAAAIAAGAQSGSGTTKLAAVVAAITPTFVAYAKTNGLATPTTETITNYVNAVVASLNAIPAAAATA